MAGLISILKHKRYMQRQTLPELCASGSFDSHQREWKCNDEGVGQLEEAVPRKQSGVRDGLLPRCPAVSQLNLQCIAG